MVPVVYGNVKTDKCPTLRKKSFSLNVFMPRTLAVAKREVQRAYFTTTKAFKPVLLFQEKEEKKKGWLHLQDRDNIQGLGIFF